MKKYELIPTDGRKSFLRKSGCDRRGQRDRNALQLRNAHCKTPCFRGACQVVGRLDSHNGPTH